MIVTQKVVIDLLIDQSLIDKFIYLKKKNKILFYLEIFKIYKKFKLSNTKILFILEPLNFKLCIFTFLFNSNLKIGYGLGKWYDSILSNKIYFDDKKHESEMHFNLLKEIDNKLNYKKKYLLLSPKIILKQKKLIEQSKIKKMIVGIHPGCSIALKEKRWPTSRFISLIIMLNNNGYKTILFGGADDVIVANEIINGLDIVIDNYVNKFNILDTAGAISLCDLFISNDSGLMHLASTLKIPVVALFGSTNIIKNAPIYKKHIILNGSKIKENTKKPILNISVKEVFNAVNNYKLNN